MVETENYAMIGLSMKKNVVLSVLVDVLKYSVLIVAGTGLFSMAPVDLIYYLLDLQNSFNGRVEGLPLDWLCAVSLIISIAYFIPILVGAGALTYAIRFYRVKISTHSRGWLIGGVIGAMAFVIGTECFLNLTQERDLENWMFWTTMMIWGLSIFAWLGHRIEALYKARGL